MSISPPPIKVSSVNVNGIRAAMRKGMGPWLAHNLPDVVAIQEVRAPAETISDLMDNAWNVASVEASAAGRAGVAVLSRHRVVEVVDRLDVPGADTTGRWIEATVDLGSVGTARPLTVVSAYVHTGDADDPDRMYEKLAFMDAAIDRLAELNTRGIHVLLTGDLNIARSRADIKNWKGNVGKAGFLPEEQARLDRLIDDDGWTDLGRTFGGDGPGPYTWWSYRGRAYDNDAGWRIDYLLANPLLAATASQVEVDRSMTYADRWSDHAPITATFDLPA